MEEWQMYDRASLFKIQEEEEDAFKALPEELQKLATTKDRGIDEQLENDCDESAVDESKMSKDLPTELPTLISLERQAEKEKLLNEAFSDWSRHDYTYFVKASAKHGRYCFDKISQEVGKSESEIKEYANAFWGERGTSRIAEHEYDRAVKMIERGEKKIGEIKELERATKILVSHFDNPWEELEFVHVNCKDKMFTAEEDRYLLCWCRKVLFIFFGFYICMMSQCSSSIFVCCLLSTGMVSGQPSKWQ
jgi:SWI/SNF-related matrix-associated actin-dependent regulator of chromatin subfamily A member 5